MGSSHQAMDKDEQAFALERISLELADPPTERELSSSIAQLLEPHLQGSEEWNYCWVDDLLDQRLQRHTGSLELLAHVVLYKSDEKCWMDPLQAIFSINRRGRITRYELRFGDQDRPSEPYKLDRKHEPSRHHRWRYRFKKDDA